MSNIDSKFKISDLSIKIVKKKCMATSFDQNMFRVLGEEEDDDPDFDPSKVKGGANPQECKQQ